MEEKVYYYRLPQTHVKEILSAFNPYFYREVLTILWDMLATFRSEFSNKEIDEMLEESLLMRCDVIALQQQINDNLFPYSENAGLLLFNKLYRLAYHVNDIDHEFLPRLAKLKQISYDPYGFYFTFPKLVRGR